MTRPAGRGELEESPIDAAVGASSAYQEQDEHLLPHHLLQ